MSAVANFLKEYFDYMVMLLFVASGILLVWVDSKKYKAANPSLKKEGVFSLVCGVVYMVVGVSLYILAKLL